MIVQMIGGIAAHANRDPNRIIRPLLNQVHRVFGGITLALGWINICIGVYDHPTWAVWLKWTGIIVYFVIIGAVFGRSEGLLRRRSAGQPIPTD